MGRLAKTKSESGVATCEQQIAVITSSGAREAGANDLAFGGAWEKLNFTALPNPKGMEWR